MGGKSIVFVPKSKLKTERVSNRIVEFADSGSQLNLASMFISKGFDIFKSIENYSFSVSAGASFISNAAYLFRFIVTPNKNISRVANLGLRALSLAIFATLTFGAAALAASVTTALLVCSALIVPVVHAIKGFYFLYKSTHAKESHRQFFKDKMIRNFLVMGVSLLIVTGLGVLFMLAPVIAPAIAMTIGVVGAVLVVGIQIWKTLPFFKNLFFPKPNANIKPEDSLHVVRSASKNFIRMLTPGTVQKIISKFERKSDDHRILKPVGQIDVKKTNKKTDKKTDKKKTEPVSGLQAFLGEIKEKVVEIFTFLKELVTNFDFYQYSVTEAVSSWKTFINEISEVQATQNDHHKIRALDFLKAFARSANEGKIPESATKEKRLVIAGERFYYDTKEELVEKIEKKTIKRNARAYYSPLKDISRTHALFRGGFSFFLKPPVDDTIAGTHASSPVPTPYEEPKQKPRLKITMRGRNQ